MKYPNSKKIFLYSTFKECDSLLYHLSQIKTFFIENDYLIVDKMKDADIIFLSGCIAAQETENRFFNIYNAIKKHYPEKTVLPTGCIVGYKNELNGIGIKNLRLLEKYFRHEIGIDKINTFNLDPSLSKDSITFHRTRDYYIHISEGCTNNCSFCATKKVKGFVSSIPMEKILNSILELRDKKLATRFVLLSDDCGSYGLDIHTDISVLLNNLINFKQTFFNINFFEPNKLNKYFDKINKEFWKKVFFINIPIQSTSSRLIRLMNRDYSIHQIFDIVRRIKIINPHITIATSIMFSVPTETEKEFNSLLQYDYPFDRIIFFPFSPRPGTMMGDMRQCLNAEKERRKKLVREFSQHDPRVGIMETDPIPIKIKFYYK